MERHGGQLGLTTALAAAACSPSPAVPAADASTGEIATATATSSPEASTTSTTSTTGSASSTTAQSDSLSTSTSADEPTGVAIDVPSFDVGGRLPGGVTCSSDLKRVVEADTGIVVETCPPAEGCLEGECVAACDAAAGAEGSLGCEFLVPTSPFFANATESAVQAGPCHAVLVANPWDRPALLELSREGIAYDVASVGRIPQGIAAATTYDALPATGVPSDQVAVVFVSHRPGVHNGNSLECPIAPAVLADTAAHGSARGAAFSLHSDTPVQVYDIIPYGGADTYLPSASLLFPATAWSDSYVAITPHEADGDPWLLAVARHDNTTVTLSSAAEIFEGAIPDPPLGVATSYALNAGETIQWRGMSDLGGSTLTADQPLGVWSGNTYLRVQTADSPESGHDSAHQMIPDVHALGARYVGAGASTRLLDGSPESTRYRLVGVADDTVLAWDPPPHKTWPETLHAGELVEFESRAAFTVTSQDAEHPFSLSQYMGGAIVGQPGCTVQGEPCPLGDDEWVVLVPPAQFLGAYTFFVDPTFATSTLTLVRETGPFGFEEVTIDCMGVVEGWEPVGGNEQFEWAHVELFRGGVGASAACETSQHRAVSDGRFGVLVWGTDATASYGYPAGGSLHTINEIDIGPRD